MRIFYFGAALALAGHACAADIATVGTGELSLDPQAGRPLFVEFQSSPKLTKEMRDRFQALGFTLVVNRDDADVALQFAAVYMFQQPMAKKQSVDFGKVVEQADGTLIASRVAAATRGPNMELAPLVQGLQGNLSTGMVLGAGIVDTILSLSGARSWFNNLVAGDPRGICLGSAETCKDWKKYVQQLRVGAIVASKGMKQVVIRADASTKEEALLPDPLFHAAMAELTKRVLARPVAPSPQAPATAGGSTGGAPESLQQAADASSAARPAGAAVVPTPEAPTAAPSAGAGESP